MYERRQEPEYQEEYDYYARKPMDLRRLDELQDWKLAEDEPDIRGWKIVDTDGNDSGEIAGLLASTEMQQAIFAVVSYGGILGMGTRKTLVPLYLCDFDQNSQRVVFKGTKDRITGAPEHKKHDTDFGKFYDYWGAERRAEVGEDESTVMPEVRKEIETEGKTVSVPVKKTRFHVYTREVEPGREVEVVIEPETEEEEKKVTETVRKEHGEAAPTGEAEIEEEEARHGQP